MYLVSRSEVNNNSTVSPAGAILPNTSWLKLALNRVHIKRIKLWLFLLVCHINLLCITETAENSQVLANERIQQQALVIERFQQRDAIIKRLKEQNRELKIAYYSIYLFNFSFWP